jgi:GNAT superfamily N-acetyltransferase
VSAYSVPRPTGSVQTVITRLEMKARPPRRSTAPPREGVQVVEARSVTASFYRYLYDAVGAPWCWTARRLIDDEELLRRIRAPGVEIHVLWVDGVPAGFVELDSGFRHGEVYIAYFGLMPEFIGAGLGRWFLDWSVQRAWDLGPRRLRVQTCDLDHPAALPNYRRAGFVSYGEAVVESISVVPGVQVNRARPFRSTV